MRAFTHDDAGVDPQRWRETPWWSAAPLVTLPPPPTHLVVLAAHPDDETLGVGGLLHAAAQAGHRITVVVASDGEASHPGSPTHSRAMLVQRRRDELVAALAVLAPDARLVRLGLADGQLSARTDAIAAALVEVLGVDTDTWLLSTWAGDGHPDHVACAAAARIAVVGRTRTRRYEYPVWFWHAGDPVASAPHLSQIARTFPLTPQDQAARLAALRAYPSQVQPLSPAPGDEAVLPASVLAHADRDREVLLDVVARAAAQPAYFEQMYQGDDGDPWRFDRSWYERRKRDLVMASLPRATFKRAFEPGSARGDLSLALAPRVEELWCAEWATGPLRVARQRLSGFPHVRIEHQRIPMDWPSGRFDLVVLSEIAYYVDDLGLLGRLVAGCLSADGVVVLVHWRRTAPDHPHTAESVHATLRAVTGLSRLVRHEEDDFLLDVLARDPRSVAEHEGLL